MGGPILPHKTRKDGAAAGRGALPSWSIIRAMSATTKLAVTVRNLLIGGGAYYVSWLLGLAYPLTLGYSRLTARIIYRGDFATAVVMPLVVGLPYALVAAGVGALVAWLAESKRPWLWAIFPAALYAYSSFSGYEWARRPALIDRTGQVIGALFLAIACLVGAIISARLLQRRRALPQTSD
jgi:hypothetical protein